MSNMESFAIAAGILGAFVVGAFFGRSFGGERSVAVPQPAASGELSDAARLELDEMYDKLRHLYDRTRKRLAQQDRNGSLDELPAHAAVFESKDAIRTRAREKGLLT